MRTMLYFNQPEIVQSMPELEPEAIKDYLINKAPFMDREGMLPVYSLSGANALYCVQNDIPLLSVDANEMLLSLRPGYKNEITQIEKSVPDLSEKLARLQAGYQYPDMKPVDFFEVYRPSWNDALVPMSTFICLPKSIIIFGPTEAATVMGDSGILCSISLRQPMNLTGRYRKPFLYTMKCADQAIFPGLKKENWISI